jgi:hypothetical protein
MQIIISIVNDTSLFACPSTDKYTKIIVASIFKYVFKEGITLSPISLQLTHCINYHKVL